MKKWIWILLIFPLFANAAYQRNQARPVNKVLFGSVETVRYISQQQIHHAQHNDDGWKTLLGAVVGGVIGHQFGGGHGRQVATVVGAAAGAGVAHAANSADPIYREQYKLVELLIKTDNGKLVDVIQDVDPEMLFGSGDQVRILYFDDGVRVDREM
ncbi:glycine zipper 2TM domain-containing protein [Vibrio sp. CAIM 722]|uniref:Glycine zipper 2TM domain-containing protein n=1 Tax=Vibrio eleionomae TaxID=2653505 RepID=A0A7X4LNY9_9VIBR|nr:glycine zipper 2TM domain-containing protein [Vibrio eleionomae]MZI95475.1 glycine zipper 2TM domain-containing protein [Vibrio eleionomae]